VNGGDKPKSADLVKLGGGAGWRAISRRLVPSRWSTLLQCRK